MRERGREEGRGGEVERECWVRCDVWGGAVRNAIRAIDAPAWLTMTSASW